MLRFEKVNNGKEWRLYREDGKYMSFDMGLFMEHLKKRSDSTFFCVDFSQYAKGVSGRPIQKPSASMAKGQGAVMNLLTYISVGAWLNPVSLKERIKTIDTISSMGYKYIRQLCIGECSKEVLKYLSQYRIEHPNDYESYVVDYWTIKDKIAQELIEKQLETYSEFFSTINSDEILAETKEILTNHIKCAKVKPLKWYKIYANNYESIKQANILCEHITPYRSSPYNLEYMIDKYFEFAKCLQFKPNAKVDLLKELAQIVNYMTVNDIDIRDTQIKKLQTQKPLAYKNDKYEVIIPTTYKELVEEGTKMHNCLSGHEYKKYISKDSRYVGFIREIGQQESEADIDISVNSMQIVQFLSKYNNRVENPDVIEFKEEYQNYLLSI